MRHLCLFLFLSSAVILPALSSYTDTAAFTLDTVDPVVDLIAPNGGEEWYIGDTNDILWTAADTNVSPCPMSLWYTVSGGLDWALLEETWPNAGSFPFVVPTYQTDSARVRIRMTDAFGNSTTRSSQSNFAITYVPPAAPQNVDVVIANAIDALISWDPVTQTIYGTPITPDGYIVLYNETPYEDDQFYYFLGRSFTTDYTHHDVAEFRSQMYYLVKAYKNYTREELALLDYLDHGLGKRLLRKEVKEMLRTGGVK
jgi:hypothetical protein